jgi:hypothetical protein
VKKSVYVHCKAVVASAGNSRVASCIIYIQPELYKFATFKKHSEDAIQGLIPSINVYERKKSKELIYQKTLCCFLHLLIYKKIENNLCHLELTQFISC